MMNGYLEFKNKIERRAQILEEIIGELQASGIIADSDSAKWRRCLAGVHDSLQDPLLKIAVVGSVKSGKSTLINAMAGEDTLRRGAGIITAFITRVMTGRDEGGWVELKSWPQINSEVNASLRMLPVQEEAGGAGDLDMRIREDREQIALRLEKMKSEWLHGPGALDPHFMFLERCLQGFSLVEEEIGDDVRRKIFDKEEIIRHQAYAGEEQRSVWVRDIELHHAVAWLGEHLEIADCQGSDSPNPAHFENLQQYLLDSHFIIYVIGSRTGLREADFKLLDFIKGLRMFPQTLFALNLDLDVHNDREDLEAITHRVRSELGWIAPDPKLFSFSALFHLLKQLEDRSPKFERRRLKIWKESKALAKASENGWKLFKEELANRVNLHRSRVLIGCGLSRLGMVAGNIGDTALVRRNAMETDMAGMRGRAEKLRNRHIALQSSLQSISDTVSGLNQSIKRELDARMADCFDPARGTIVGEALELVEHYPQKPLRQSQADMAKLIRQYYRFYLEFRRGLSRHLIENVNLRIIEFAKNEEYLLEERLRNSSEALWSFFGAALGDYRRELLGATSENDSPGSSLPEFGSYFPPADRMSGTVPPCFSSYLERDGLGRGILFIKFGVTSLPGILAGIRTQINKSAEKGIRENPLAEQFQKAGRTARNEIRSELLRAFAEFRENLAKSYLYRKVDERCISLLEEFKARAEMTQVDFVNLLKTSGIEGNEKNAAIDLLTRTRRITSAMIEELEEIRRAAAEPALQAESDNIC